MTIVTKRTHQDQSRSGAPLRPGDGKSWEEAKKNPDAAVDATLKAKPDLNRHSTLDQLMVDIELLDSPNSKGRIGWGAQADWDQTIALLKQYRDLQTDKPWTAFHTNEFLPK